MRTHILSIQSPLWEGFLCCVDGSFNSMNDSGLDFDYQGVDDFWGVQQAVCWNVSKDNSLE